ncbi:MAG: hypothetical protein CME62_00190 [Halobacteriovoraceae bacterium]|nr:hypothetical protein [Halobacteriovoraceae bacterium]|tara:strand:+ start:854 stop:1255 length:402 start_codon:yes stop_codon:yes gene_type:complete
MLKTVLLGTLILGSLSAQARICGETPIGINTERVFAEVVYRSHLELDLVVVRKGAINPKYNVMKIMGGKGFKPNTVPTCDSEQGIAMTWSNDTMANNETQDYDGQTTSYRICEYDVQGNLIVDEVICNFASGD